MHHTMYSTHTNMFASQRTLPCSHCITLHMYKQLLFSHAVHTKIIKCTHHCYTLSHGFVISRLLVQPSLHKLKDGQTFSIHTTQVNVQTRLIFLIWRPNHFEPRRLKIEASTYFLGQNLPN
jgi:hypothetical protein